MAKKAAKVIEYLGASLKAEKKWTDPAKDISLESLRRLDNIYDQFKNTKKAIGGDSEEYKELKAALEQVHVYYEKRRSNTAELSVDEKKEILKSYEMVADKAIDYLRDKRFKRGTDSGEERYNIAFAALAITAGGEAKQLAEEHNYFREHDKVKKVTLDDLMKRSNVNYEDFRKEQKRAKKGAEAGIMDGWGKEHEEKVLKNDKVLLPVRGGWRP